MGINLNSSNFAETIGNVGSDPKNKYITKSQDGHSYRLDSKKDRSFNTQNIIETTTAILHEMKAKNLDEHQVALDHLKHGVTHLKQKLETTKAKFTFSVFGLFTFTIPFFGKAKLEKFIEEYKELEQQITKLKARSADIGVSEEMQLLVDHEEVVLGENSSKRNFHLEEIKAAVAKRDQSGEQVLEADGGDGVSGLSSSRKNYEKLPDSLKAELKAAVKEKKEKKEE